MDTELTSVAQAQLTQTNILDAFAAFLTLGVIVAVGLVSEKEVSYD